MLGTEVGDLDWLLERRARRDNLGEDVAQMLGSERPRILGYDTFDHLALTHGLIDRRGVGMFEMADLLRHASTLGKQVHELQVDVVDALAELVERSASGSGFFCCGRSHRGGMASLSRVPFQRADGAGRRSPSQQTFFRAAAGVLLASF